MAVSDEMVERGARAIASYLSDGDGGPRYDDLSKKNQEAALDTARACLNAALSDQVVVPKEPTPEMIGAWYRYKSGFHFADDPPPRDTSDYGAYRAMIAAVPASTPVRSSESGDSR